MKRVIDRRRFVMDQLGGRGERAIPRETCEAGARELSLSVKTISTYRGRLLEKMGMFNNAQLVHYAFQNNLVEHHAQDLGSPAE